MIEWLNNNRIEVAGASLAFLYLILEVRQKWQMWIVGVLSSAFYVYIFYQARLFANMGMNVYYTFMSVYGLYCWKFAKTNESGKENDFHFISPGLVIRLSIAALFIFGFIYFILIKFPESEVLVPDALVATLSIIATWMTAKKIVECWYLWIFVNFFAIGLYAYQELYPTAILYIFYGTLSIVGLINWRKSVISKK
ncbi:MAG: nicotinamide riboside transporter PnuC [Dysgonamonadaceae bacterium]|jgi:nicotinamide mononucleotide transporter|nr:nicotinamide riboside transporter PnuC [Dysgonamonadaceae bacterium]